MLRPLGFLLAISALPAAILAQGLSPVPAAPPGPPALLQQEGLLWGVGDTYKVAFAATGTTFVPRLGDRAPHNAPLTFHAERIGRGTTATALPASEPVAAAQAVELRRPEVTERWELQPDGVEFRFVFDQLPAGDGDLWVELGLATDLVVEPAGAGLLCTWPGIGGCRIGGVTGIDADGDRVAGTLHHDGGRLRLSLPAAFVAEARLPLVLDPLVGGVFVVDGGSLSQRLADAAVDVLSGNRLVVYQEVISASDHDIYGVVVGPTGTFGSRLPLVISSAHDTGVQVAAVFGASRFVLAWIRNGDVLATTVNQLGGGIVPLAVVSNNANTLSDVDIGGDQSALANAALVVWRDATANRIEARPVQVGSTGALTMGANTLIDSQATTQPLERPRVSKQTGTGRHLLVWSRKPAGGTNNTDVVCRAADWTAAGSSVALGAVTVLDNSAADSGRPEVDGDGSRWGVVWMRTVSSSDSDLDGVGVRSFAPGVLAGSVQQIVVDNSNLDYDPAVCCTGGSYLLCWGARAIGTGAFGLAAKGLDLFGCTACGPRITIPDTSTQLGLISACADGTSPYGNQAWIVYDNVQDVKALQWTADDGIQLQLDGACGTNARHFTTCAQVGNSAFAVRLTGATGVASASLVLSPSTWNLPCNTCRLVPDPTVGALFLALPVSNGEASQALAIPPDAALAGLPFWSQWLLHPTTGPSCVSLGSHFTYALQTTIQ